MKANNKYMPDHKPKADSSCLMYLDANNLYGWAMSQKITCKMQRWGKAATLKKILKTPDNSPKVYIVEVDLEFPQRLHDKFKIVSTLPRIPNA